MGHAVRPPVDGSGQGRTGCDPGHAGRARGIERKLDWRAPALRVAHQPGPDQPGPVPATGSTLSLPRLVSQGYNVCCPLRLGINRIHAHRAPRQAQRTYSDRRQDHDRAHIYRHLSLLFIGSTESAAPHANQAGFTRRDISLDRAQRTNGTVTLLQGKRLTSLPPHAASPPVRFGRAAHTRPRPTSAPRPRSEESEGPPLWKARGARHLPRRPPTWRSELTGRPPPRCRSRSART